MKKQEKTREEIKSQLEQQVKKLNAAYEVSRWLSYVMLIVGSGMLIADNFSTIDNISVLDNKWFIILNIFMWPVIVINLLTKNWLKKKTIKLEDAKRECYCELERQFS